MRLTGRLGLPACELLWVNQTPDVEMPDWTADTIEAVGQVCGDDVERFGWRQPKIGLADVSDLGVPRRRDVCGGRRRM
jgi:hypothetical protein